MRSRLLLMSICALLAGILQAQPNNWWEDSPADFEPLTFLGEYDYYTEGTTALRIIFTETGTPYFVSDTFQVTAEAAFDFSIDILDNDPGAEINQRVRFIDAEGNGTNVTSSVYSTDNADYQTYTFSETAPATAVQAYVIIRMYDVSASWEGSATFWLDNAIFTQDGGTTNLLVNGGFEDWPTPDIEEGSTLLNWMESSPLEWVPITIEPEISQVTHGLTAVNITFTETGTPYFVSDTFNVTANSSFSWSVDVLDNHPGGEVNQRIRFINASGEGTNFTSGDYSVDNPDYQTYTYTGTTPADAVKAYVIIRMYDVSASWEGSASFLLDHNVYSEDNGANLLANPSYEQWAPPSGKPEFLSYSFAGLDPEVLGLVNKQDYTVTLTVPFETDLSALVATFELTAGATAKIGDTEQVSGVTANDFSNPLTYTLSSEDGTLVQDWVVRVEKEAAATGKAILSFRFEDLDPPVNGMVSPADFKVSATVPSGTDLSTLVPTLVLSDKASSSPESGVATDFTNPVNYTVTAQDGSTQVWVVTVTEAPAGTTVLFSEDFEGLTTLPSDWVIINADGYTQASGEERWQDSAWLVTTTSRLELSGTKVAMASSYTSDMPMDGKAYDWMILPSVSLGDNTILSWQAMSTTSSGNYPDDYMVLIAPAVSGVTPNVTYFEEEANILIEVEPESWSANVGRPGNGVSSYSINLKEKRTPSASEGWFDRDVWIAFVLTTDLYTNPDTGEPNSSPGGSNLAVDNIQMVNVTGTSVEDIQDRDAGVSIYPNPSTGLVNLRLKAEGAGQASISIQNILGKQVFRIQESVSSGQTEIQLDLSELEHGLYLVRTEINDRFSVTKLVIE